MNDNYTDKLDDLMDRYVFGLLDEATAGRVRRKIEEDPQWSLAYEAAAGRKQALATAVRGTAGEAAATRAPSADEVLAAARAGEARARRKQRIIRGVFAGAAAAAAVVVVATWLRAAWVTAPRFSVRVVGQEKLLSGSPASLLAIVTDLAGNRVAGVPVKLLLRGADAAGGVELARWITDADGRAAGPVELPDWDAGSYTLLARAGSWYKASTLETPIRLKRSVRLYLSTDKPIYKPAQTVHMRCLVLRRPALRPDAGRQVEFNITDPSGNVVFRQVERLSDFGIASADLPTDPLITPGRYTVKVAAGDDTSEQTVDIFHYKLPAFAVKVQLDRPYYLPGATVTGSLEVRYHFGKPAAEAKVALELVGRQLTVPFAIRKTTVTTDKDGKAEFRFVLPRRMFGSRRTAGDAHLLLSARATDTAGQENTAFRTVVVAAQDIRVAVVTDSAATVKGFDSRAFVVTSYPDGRPAKTVVDVESLARSFPTDEAGVAVISAERLPSPLRISARDAAGKTGSAEVPLPRARRDAFVLRTDRPIYTAGQTARVEVVSATPGDVFLDVVKDRQTLLTKTLTLTGTRGVLPLDLPAEVSGVLHLHAYRLDADSEWVGRDVLIVVRPAGQLTVEVRQDRKVYRPGEEAKLIFQVADGGKGTASALSLAAVDEAVYAVQQAAPGLEGVLTGLDEEILKPAIEVHGLSPGLMGRSEDYARAVLAAAAPAGADQARPHLAPADEKLHTLNRDNGIEAQTEFRQKKRSAQTTARGATAIGAAAAVVALLLLGMFWSVGTPAELGGWFRARSAVCLGVLVALGLGTAALTLPTLHAAREIPALHNLEKMRAAEPLVRGQAAEAPADEVADLAVNSPVLTEQLAGKPRAKEIMADGEKFKKDGGGSAEPPRTRTYFPETMLWRPQLVTDAAGRAELTIPLADSITTWRLSGMAVSRAGRLGTLDSATRVFQPFFVDVDAPLALTAGDEVSVPLVLYNYAAEALEVYLAAEGADGLAVLDGKKASILVTPGEVQRVYVRVRADEIGQAKLKVTASAGRLADAIERPIRVVPPGVPQSLVVNGQLADGEQFVDLTVPADAVAGSVAVRMKIYPSTFSELLDGLEGIFRMPSGCFEQTSSTTWPNVMALAYLRANGLEKPEIVAKATRYIHLGYQRLLGFEVKGGGFDWFGRPPANVVLTAYGLMEFADMAKVHNVDPKLLKRTADWLAARQAQSGAWAFQRGIFHEPFTAGDNSPLAITAYITWAIGSYQGDHPAARRGAEYVAENLAKTDNPHTLALCANALLTAERTRSVGLDAARRLATMAEKAGEDGKRWAAGRHDVSTTALAVLALTQAGHDRALVHDALRWLAARRDGYGTWGSTTPTVLALRALLSGAGAPEPRTAEAVIGVARNGAKGDLASLTIPPELSDIVQTATVKGLTQPGTYRLRLKSRGAEGMAYQFAVRYHSLAAAGRAKPAAGLAVEVRYDRTDLDVGGLVTVRATVANRTNSTAHMLVVDLGTPPGFAVRAEGLEKLIDQRKIQRYTLTARGVIVYLDQLGPRARLDLDYQIAALMPLKAVAAPTEVYSYYNPDQRAAARPTRFVVK